MKYVSELDTELFMLNLLYSDPEKELQAINKRGTTPLSEGYSVSFRSVTGGGGFIGIVMTDYTIKFSKSGEEFFFAPKQVREKVYNATKELYLAKTAEEVRNSVSSVIKAVEEEREVARTQMERWQAGIPEWNLIDFCYFSTSTMTTIGYGDIIPNNTLVRLVVMSQALVGVVLAGFAFSLLWPPITKDVESLSPNSPASPAQDCAPSAHSAPSALDT
ncbi:MAG TPA: potassium channel family protein [Pyrinomonadaceae bacterium]